MGQETEGSTRKGPVVGMASVIMERQGGRVGGVGLPDLTNTNIGKSVKSMKSEFQIRSKYFFSISVSQTLHRTYLH